MARETQIGLFWNWWRKNGRDAVRADVEASRPNGRAHQKLRREVGYLDGGMRFDLGPGTTARYRLTLRPLSDPRLRLIARTWLANAPESDALWEYALDRPPQAVTATYQLATVAAEPALVEDIREYLHLDEDEDFLDAIEQGMSEDEAIEQFLENSGVEVKVETVALAEIRVVPTWDEETERADIAFWHPGLARTTLEEGQDMGVGVIGRWLGDADMARWIGALTIDPALRGGLDLGGLRAWLDAHAQRATGDRWHTARRLGHGKRHVAIRFNAARKAMDAPLDGRGLLVVMYRDVADVEADEVASVQEAIRDLASHLAPGTERLIEISEEWRLSIIWLVADKAADVRAAKAWQKRHRALESDLDIEAEATWIKRFQLGEMRPYRGEWAAAPSIRTRPDGRLYRRAHWIERHPWRVLSGPIFIALGAVVMSIVIPSMARDAGLLLIGAAGVGGLGLTTWWAASTYVTLKNNPALGILALLIDGWRIAVGLVVSLVLIIVYIDAYLTK